MLFITACILVENTKATKKIDFVLWMHYLTKDQLLIFRTWNK